MEMKNTYIFGWNRELNRNSDNEEDSTPSTYPIWLSPVDNQRHNRWPGSMKLGPFYLHGISTSVFPYSSSIHETVVLPY